MSSGKWRPFCLGLNVLNWRRPMDEDWYLIQNCEIYSTKLYPPKLPFIQAARLILKSETPINMMLTTCYLESVYTSWVDQLYVHPVSRFPVINPSTEMPIRKLDGHSVFWLTREEHQGVGFKPNIDFDCVRWINYTPCEFTLGRTPGYCQHLYIAKQWLIPLTRQTWKSKKPHTIRLLTGALMSGCHYVMPSSLGNMTQHHKKINSHVLNETPPYYHCSIPCESNILYNGSCDISLPRAPKSNAIEIAMVVLLVCLCN